MIENILPVLMLISLLTSNAFGGEREITLVISVQDGVSFTNKFHKLLIEEIKGLLPGQDVLDITTQTTKVTGFTKAIRNDLLDQIDDINLKGHRIKNLILATHGTTRSNEKGETMTNLQHLGSFGSNGMDKNLNEILEPFKGHFSEGLRVHLHACSTFCGSEEQVVSRGKALLADLGVDEGSVFGLRQVHYEAYLLESEKASFKNWIVGLGEVIPASLILMPIGLIFSVGVAELSIEQALPLSVLGTSILISGQFIAKSLNVLRSIKSGGSHWGSLLSFTESGSVKVEKLQLTTDNLKAIHCSQILFPEK